MASKKVSKLKIRDDRTHKLEEADIDAVYFDGHTIEPVGIESDDPNTIPTTAQVKAYVDAGSDTSEYIEYLVNTNRYIIGETTYTPAEASEIIFSKTNLRGISIKINDGETSGYIALLYFNGKYWDQEGNSCIQYTNVCNDVSYIIEFTYEVGANPSYNANYLIQDLQHKIDGLHKLASDLVYDTNQTHKFVSTSEKSYWDSKQERLISGTNIKTINGESILGSGNLDSRDEKARKLLGEFDIYPYNNDDTKTLRQTWYVDLDKITNWRQATSGSVNVWYTDLPSPTSELQLYASKYTFHNTDWTSLAVGECSLNGSNYQTFYINNGSTTEKPTGILQYKLTTSYVENVIPSGQILNLDSKGCTFVRDEYEKTLNLLDYDNRLTGKSLSNTGEIRDNANTFVYPFVRVKPNTTYRIYGKHDFWILHYTESKSVIGDSNTEVFTTESNCYYLRTDCYNQYTECMLIEDIGARIPYQNNYGKIIHEKDINIVASELKNLIDNNWGNYQGRITSGSMNDCTAPGYYQITDTVTDQPITSTYGKLLVLPWGYEVSHYMTQVYITQPDVTEYDRVFLRGHTYNGWTSWRELVSDVYVKGKNYLAETRVSNNTNLHTFVDTLANIHQSSSAEELNLYRFYAENYANYNLPCVDSHIMVFSIDNTTNWDRIIAFDIRSTDVYLKSKTNNTWGDWVKLINSRGGTFYNPTDNSVIDITSGMSSGYANLNIYNTNSNQKWTIGRQGTDGRFYIGYYNGSSWNDAQFQIDTAVGRAYLNGLQLITSKTVYIGDTTGYTSGWFRIAKIAPNGSFVGGYIQCTLLIIGSWNYEKNTNAEISISSVHTRIKATQICGEIGDISAIRFVLTNTDNYYVDVYLTSSGPNNRGPRAFTFVGNVAVTDMNAQGNSPLSSSDTPTYQLELEYGISTNVVRVKDFIYGDTGYGIKMKSYNTGSWKEGLRIYQASNNYAVLALVNNDNNDYVTAIVSNSVTGASYLERHTSNGNYLMGIPERSGTLALHTDVELLNHKGGVNDFDDSQGIRIGTISGGSSTPMGNGWGSYMQIMSTPSHKPSDQAMDNWVWQLFNTTDGRTYVRNRTNGSSWGNIYTIAYTSDLPHLYAHEISLNDMNIYIKATLYTNSADPLNTYEKIRSALYSYEYDMMDSRVLSACGFNYNNNHSYTGIMADSSRVLAYYVGANGVDMLHTGLTAQDTVKTIF